MKRAIEVSSMPEVSKQTTCGVTKVTVEVFRCGSGPTASYRGASVRRLAEKECDSSPQPVGTQMEKLSYRDPVQSLLPNNEL
jgi:hypothetical protein